MVADGVQATGRPEQVQRKASGRGESREATKQVQGRGLEAPAGGVGATTQQNSRVHVKTPNVMIEQNIVVQGAAGVSAVQHSQGVAVQAPSKDPEAQGTSMGIVRVSAEGKLVDQGYPGVQEASGMKGAKGVHGVPQGAKGDNQGVQRGATQGTQAAQRGAQAPEAGAQGAQVTSQCAHVVSASVQDGGSQKTSKGVQFVAPQEEGAAAASRQGQVIVIGGRGAQGMELETQSQQLPQLSTVHKCIEILDKGHAVQGDFVGQVVVDPDNHHQIPTTFQQVTEAGNEQRTPYSRQPHQAAEISNPGSSVIEANVVAQEPIGPGVYFENQEGHLLLSSITRKSYIAQEEDETITSSSHTMMFPGGQPQQPADMYVMAGEAEQWSSVASVMRQPTSVQGTPHSHHPQIGGIGPKDAIFVQDGRNNITVQGGSVSAPFIQYTGQENRTASDGTVMSSPLQQPPGQDTLGARTGDPRQVHFQGGPQPCSQPSAETYVEQLVQISAGRLSKVQRNVSRPEVKVEAGSAAAFAPHKDDVRIQGPRWDQNATSRHQESPPLAATPMTRGGELKHFLHGA